MSTRRRCPSQALLNLLISLCSSAACTVEPPFEGDAAVIPRDAARADASSDAGAPDAAIACWVEGIRCPPGTFCAQSGACTPIMEGGACRSSGECAPFMSCAGGTCRSLSGLRCRSATDCAGAAAGAHCTALGYCAPAFSERVPLSFACQRNTDCGASRPCVAGVCAPCTGSTLCPSIPACAPGACCAESVCVEPLECGGPEDCYLGNVCSGGRCARSTEGCARDLANDEPEGATVLTEAFTAGLSICGDADVDWYLIDIPAMSGARIAVVSTATGGATFAAELRADRGAQVAGVTRLEAPRITLITARAERTARTVLLVVRGLDTSGAYAIDLARTSSVCTGDAFDLYGDRDPRTAPIIAAGERQELVACSEDLDVLRVEVDREDALELQIDASGLGGGTIAAQAVDAGGRCLLRDPATGECRPALFRRTTTATVATARATRAGFVELVLTASVAPTLGGRYTVRAARVGGARARACSVAVETSGGRVALPFAGAEDTGSPLCAFVSAPEPDRVVRVAPLTPGVLRAIVRGPAAAGRFGLALLDACGANAPITCDRSPRAGVGAAVEHVLTSTRSVFLLVSAENASGLGAAGLEAEVEITIDATDNYTCRGARSEPILASGARSVSTVEATDTARIGGMCGLVPSGGGIGPDRFYSLFLGGGERAALELRGPSGGLLWAATDCARLTATCTAAATITAVAPAQVLLRPARPALYTIAVDGLGAEDAGDYVLETFVNPECVADGECRPGVCRSFRCAPREDSEACDGALLMPAAGRVVVRATMADAADDFSQVCEGLPGVGAGEPDRVYRLAVPAGLAEIDAVVTSAEFDPLLAVRRGVCGSAGAQVACVDDQRGAGGSFISLLPRVRITSPPAGTYYFIVDTVSGDGTFALEITLR